MNSPLWWCSGESPKVSKCCGCFLSMSEACEVVNYYKADVVNQSQQVNGTLQLGIAAYSLYVVRTYIVLQCLPS